MFKSATWLAPYTGSAYVIWESTSTVLMLELFWAPEKGSRELGLDVKWNLHTTAKYCSSGENCTNPMARSECSDEDSSWKWKQV